MAIPVKNIEREFLLSTALRERAQVLCITEAGEWMVRMVSISPTIIGFSHDIPLGLLKKGSSCEFRYTIRDQTIAFRSTMMEPGERRFGVSMPEKLFKNLSRKYVRLAPPKDLTASFTFAGERYDLKFPPSAAFVPASEPEPSPDFDSGDLRGLVGEFEDKALEIGSERGIVMFKDRLPESVEERLVASSGRCFYLPTATGGIPRSDPFAARTILTRDDFLAHFVESGLEPDFAEDEVVRLERSRRTEGILSELIVPILFQDYTIGYAVIMNKHAGKPPMDLAAVERFVAFARIFSWSLKLHGYFKDAPKLDETYQTQVVDVSVGGLLFACDDQRLIQALREGTQVGVRLDARHRAIEATGVTRRHHATAGEAFFGIEFSVMAPEDFRFLFEYLYGRPFTDDESSSVEGIRIHSP
jgi:hypothetical protein